MAIGTQTTGAGRTWKLASADATAPTLATDGITLDGATALNVYVSADSTKTLLGAGTLQAYLYDSVGVAPGRWARCPDLDLSVTTSAVRDLTFSGLTVPGPRGRIFYAASGVTVSSGTVTIQICAFVPALEAFSMS